MRKLDGPRKALLAIMLSAKTKVKQLSAKADKLFQRAGDKILRLSLT